MRISITISGEAEETLRGEALVLTERRLTQENPDEEDVNVIRLAKHDLARRLDTVRSRQAIAEALLQRAGKLHGIWGSVSDLVEPGAIV